MKHPHSDLIHAWADGAKIEWRDKFSGEWFEENPPRWNETEQYRIAPELQKYRVALIKTSIQSWTTTVDDPTLEKQFERTEGFSRWLTTWTEYNPDPAPGEDISYPPPVDPPAQG